MLTNQFGCDSTIITQTSLLPSDSTFLTNSSCNPADTGIVVEMLTNQFGCDSTIITQTSLLPNDSTFLFDESCNPADTGIVIELSMNQFGCDSTIITLTQLILPSVKDTNAIICEGDTLWINNAPYTSTGAFTEILPGEAANGCDSIINIMLNVLPNSNSFIEAIICDGETYDFNGTILTTEGIYESTVPASNGCDSLITLDLQVQMAVQENQFFELCSGESLTINGTVYDEDNPSGTEIFTDIYGCDSLILNVNIQFNVLQANFSILDPTCFGENDGFIFIDTVIGNAGPFEYSINGGESLPIGFFPFPISRLEGGIYDIEIQDANECIVSNELELTEPDEPVVSLGVDQTIQLGDSIQLNAQTNLLDPVVFWIPAEQIDCVDCLDPFVRPFETTIYVVAVEDANGCSAQDEIRIIVERTERVFIPNAISPNGDGFNEDFVIYADETEVSLIKRLNIYDRWGEQVFTAENFPPNNPNFGWNGSYRDQDVLPGVYVYYVEVEFADGSVELYKGGITVVK